MGSNYLCTTKRAIHPFFIESIGINIYSLEELLYYLVNYIYLIDDTILNEELCEWLETELQLIRASKAMRRALEKKEGAVLFLMPLFQESGYYTREEQNRYLEQIQNIQVESDDIRRKRKADYLVSFGMYVSAIAEYERILNSRSPGRLGVQFYGQVLECMATAYARMFQFEEAADCLWEAYQTLRSRKIYEKYLRILPLFLPRQQYFCRLEEIHANPEEARRLRSETEGLLRKGMQNGLAWSVKEADEEKQLEELKSEYVRNSTGTR